MIEQEVFFTNGYRFVLLILTLIINTQQKSVVTMWYVKIEVTCYFLCVCVNVCVGRERERDSIKPDSSQLIPVITFPGRIDIIILNQ